MRKCNVYVNGALAGVLTEDDNRREYTFKYCKEYIEKKLPPVALSMPVREEEFRSTTLFPYFFNLLSEGENRDIQASIHHIDKEDDFGILLATSQHDTIGAVTIKPITD